MGVVVPLNEPKDARASLEPMLRLVETDMAGVNQIILNEARSDVDLIPELAHHLIDSGGKRMRPMLTIAAAKLCGYEGDGPYHAGRQRRVHAHRHAAARRCGGRERHAPGQEDRASRCGAIRPACWWAISCWDRRSR